MSKSFWHDYFFKQSTNQEKKLQNNVNSYLVLLFSVFYLSFYYLFINNIIIFDWPV